MFEPCSSVVAGPPHAGQFPTNHAQPVLHHEYLLQLDPALVNARLPVQPVAVSVQQMMGLIWHCAKWCQNGCHDRPILELAVRDVPVGVVRVWGGRLSRTGDQLVLTARAHVATACHEIVPVQLQIAYRSSGRAEAVRLQEIG